MSPSVGTTSATMKFLPVSCCLTFPVGGIWPLVIFRSNRLRFADPGTMAGPLFPPLSNRGRDRTSRSPWRWTQPWQWTHKDVRIGTTSRSKTSSAGRFAAGESAWAFTDLAGTRDCKQTRATVPYVQDRNRASMGFTTRKETVIYHPYAGHYNRPAPRPYHEDTNQTGSRTMRQDRVVRTRHTAQPTGKTL